MHACAMQTYVRALVHQCVVLTLFSYLHVRLSAAAKAGEQLLIESIGWLKKVAADSLKSPELQRRSVCTAVFLAHSVHFHSVCYCDALRLTVDFPHGCFQQVAAAASGSGKRSIHDNVQRRKQRTQVQQPHREEFERTLNDSVQLYEEYERYELKRVGTDFELVCDTNE